MAGSESRVPRACWLCKERKQKCDLQRPCSRCADKDIHCSSEVPPVGDPLWNQLFRSKRHTMRADLSNEHLIAEEEARQAKNRRRSRAAALQQKQETQDSVDLGPSKPETKRKKSHGGVTLGARELAMLCQASRDEEASSAAPARPVSAAAALGNDTVKAARLSISPPLPRTERIEPAPSRPASTPPLFPTAWSPAAIPYMGYHPAFLQAAFPFVMQSIDQHANLNHAAPIIPTPQGRNSAFDMTSSGSRSSSPPSPPTAEELRATRRPSLIADSAILATVDREVLRELSSRIGSGDSETDEDVEEPNSL